MSNYLIIETRSYNKQPKGHSHPYAQLLLPLEGSLYLKTNNYDIKLDTDHLFLIPSHCYHAYHSEDYNRFLVLDIPTDVIPAFHIENCKFESYQKLDERWRALRFLFNQEQDRKNESTLRHLVNYASLILTEDIMPRSIQYIHDHLNQHFNIEHLARIENFNPTYYVEWFKKKTKMTPHHYIQKLRIHKAKANLSDTELTLTKISELVGYEHQSSLTRAFIKHEGISPLKYRQGIRK